MLSWLVRLFSGRAVWVIALTEVIVSRHFTLAVPLSIRVYKWVLANYWGNLTKLRGVTCDGLTSPPGEVEILLAASCYRNQNKPRQLHGSLAAPTSSKFHW